MNPFQSTIDEPLRFLNAYLRFDGQIFLEKKFVKSDAPDFKYDYSRHVIIAQEILPREDQRGEVLDAETNTREYEITFPEFLSNEFAMQLDITKRLIREQSRSNSDGQDKKLYRKILIDCLDLQKVVDRDPELPFRSEINRFIRDVLTYSYKKFNRYHNVAKDLATVKKYYQQQKENLTGFKLKDQQRNGTIHDFSECLKDHLIVSRRTPTESFIEFLSGKIPKQKINWINDDLHMLVGLVNTLISDDILDNAPKQQWKHLRDVFSWKGEVLPENWHRNHNKLKDKAKIRRIERVVDFLRPRPQNQ